MQATTQTREHHDIERIARRRAGAKMGWYIHATVFVAVNLMLALLMAAIGRPWLMVPSIGWAIGLAIHGAVVFLVTGGAGLHERLLKRERERLTLQRDPW
jgi:hypothetical protein